MKSDSVKGVQLELYLIDLLKDAKTTGDLQDLEYDMHERVRSAVQIYAEEIDVDYIGIM